MTFLAAYGPTESTRDGGKNELSGQPALDGIVKEMPKHEQLFVLIGGNARTGRRGGGRPGSEYCGVLETRNGHDERLLAFVSNIDLALVKTPDISHTTAHTPRRATRKHWDHMDSQ